MFRLVIWPSMMLLGWTETKLWSLKYGSKSIQTSLTLRKRPPKPYKLLNIFYQFCGNCKILSCTFCLKEDEMKIAMFAHFKRVYMIFGGRCLKIKDVCMDFETYFKVHNLVSVHPKSVILGQMTNLNSPQFPGSVRENIGQGRDYRPPGRNAVRPLHATD